MNAINIYKNMQSYLQTVLEMIYIDYIFIHSQLKKFFKTVKAIE